MTALFYVASAVAVVASLLAVTRTNALHALLNLIVALFAVALIFLALGAPFIAALEIIVYAGAIMVLILFVIMMLNQGKATMEQERRMLPARGWIVPVLLAASLGVLTVGVLLSVPEIGTAGEVIGPGPVGRLFFGPYVVGVELAAILLLAGLVGAYYLGVRE